jgi:hypothetical protein
MRTSDEPNLAARLQQTVSPHHVGRDERIGIQDRTARDSVAKCSRVSIRTCRLSSDHGLLERSADTALLAATCSR